MVTLAGTQNFNEFELHLRAILSLPIAEITLEKAGASAVILVREFGQPNLHRDRAIAALPNRFSHLRETELKTLPQNGCCFGQ
jgi:phosphoribosylglycinamide formyltransferase 2